MQSLSSPPGRTAVNESVIFHKLPLYREGVRLGTWSLDEIQDLYDEGLVLLSDYLWREGMKEGTSVQHLLRSLPKRRFFSKDV